jgi:2,4'-dihydroxyacetophenone dioxygenase
MDNAAADDALAPYQLPFPADALSEIVIPRAVPDDERMWVPQANNVWFRPLCLNRSTGYWMNLLRARRAGMLSRHTAIQTPCTASFSRDAGATWSTFAEEGSYVFEPPGETHTLVVPDGVEEMITYFQVNGVMCYVDPWGQPVGYEDVFTKIDMCRKHFAEVGLGADFVDQFIR